MTDVIIRCDNKETCEKVIKKILVEKGVLNDRLEAVNVLFAEIPESKIAEFRLVPGVLELNIDEEVAPSQTLSKYQYMMGIDEFKKNVSRGKGVKVGIVDTGVNKDHPSLRPNFVEGHNVVNNTTDVSDTYNHGTKVAGIVCSIGPDYEGVAPESKIYVAKVMSSDNHASVSSIIKGINWCISKNVDIINISMSGVTPCSTYQFLVDIATKNNIIVVASAGYASSPGAPACTPGVICTGSVRPVDDSFAQYFSCTTSRIDVVALGFALITTSATGGLIGFFATSAAASVISGMLALLKSAYPTMSRQDLINKLFSLCEDLGAPGQDSIFGRGIPIMSSSIEPTPTPPIESYPIQLSSVPSGADITVD